MVGIVCETVQAEGGDNHASPAFFQGLQDIAAKVSHRDGREWEGGWGGGRDGGGGCVRGRRESSFLDCNVPSTAQGYNYLRKNMRRDRQRGEEGGGGGGGRVSK